MSFVTPTSRNRFRVRLAPFDAIWLVVAPVAALLLRDPRLVQITELEDLNSAPFQFIAIAILSGLVSALAFRLSEGMSRFFSVHDVIAICGAVLTSVAITSVFLFTFTRLDGIPRSTPAIYAMVLGAGLIVARTVHRVVIAEAPPSALAVRPDRLRNIVIVGADRFASAAIKLIACQSPATARVIAVLDERSGLIGRSISGVRVAGSAHDLESVLDEYAIHGVEIDQVLHSAEGLSPEALIVLSEACESREIDFRSISDAFNLTVVAAAGSVAEAKPAPTLISIPAYFKLKRLVDVVISVALIVALAPVALIVAVLVLVDVGTPLLFWQERIGRNGRRFLLYKFRTYRAPFDWQGEPVAEADRLSGIGRFIRATRLDEIPQLLNILVGDMGLIGPRPLLPRDQPSDPTLRLLARPGITGWAQVNGGNFVTPEEKDALDVWYVQNASVLVDLKIIAHTLIIVATGERFDRRAVAEALSWREQLQLHDTAAQVNGEATRSR